MPVRLTRRSGRRPRRLPVHRPDRQCSIFPGATRPAFRMSRQPATTAALQGMRGRGNDRSGSTARPARSSVFAPAYPDASCRPDLMLVAFPQRQVIRNLSMSIPARKLGPGVPLGITVGVPLGIKVGSLCPFRDLGGCPFRDLGGCPFRDHGRCPSWDHQPAFPATGCEILVNSLKRLELEFALLGRWASLASTGVPWRAGVPWRVSCCER